MEDHLCAVAKTHANGITYSLWAQLQRHLGTVVPHLSQRRTQDILEQSRHMLQRLRCAPRCVNEQRVCTMLAASGAHSQRMPGRAQQVALCLCAQWAIRFPALMRTQLLLQHLPN